MLCYGTTIKKGRHCQMSTNSTIISAMAHAMFSNSIFFNYHLNYICNSYPYTRALLKQTKYFWSVLICSRASKGERALNLSQERPCPASCCRSALATANNPHRLDGTWSYKEKDRRSEVLLACSAQASALLTSSGSQPTAQVQIQWWPCSPLHAAGLWLLEQ